MATDLSKYEESSALSVNDTSCEEVEAPAITIGPRSFFSDALQKMRIVTVEPVLFGSFLVFGLQGFLSTNFLLERICSMTLNLSVQICSNLSCYPELDDEVQKRVTNIELIKNLASCIPAIPIALMLGSWSDHYGRKLPMMLSSLGGLFGAMIFLLITQVPWIVPEYIILLCIPNGLTGGFIVLIMSCYSYMSDITDVHTRTTRITFMAMATNLALPLGLYLSTLVFEKYGYLGVNSLAVLIYGFIAVYIIFFLKESRQFSTSVSNTEPIVTGNGSCYNFCGCKNLADSVNVSLKMRPNYGRARIFGLLFCLCSLVFTFGGTSLIFLYTQKQFQWTYIQYSYYQIWACIANTVVISTVMPLLSWKLQINDMLLGVLGGTSELTKLLITAFAFEPWYMYLAAAISCLSGMSNIVARAAISKLVPPDELGGIFAILASLELVMPLMYNPVYTWLYNSTLDTFPGAIYILSAVLTICSLMVYLLQWACFRHEENITYASL